MSTRYIVFLLLVIAGAFSFYYYETTRSIQPTANNDSIDFKNASYEIDNSRVQLVNGRFEVEVAPGSSSKIVTEYFGNEVNGDFNGDGKEDVAFLITVSGGGSGTFYYVAVALKSETGYRGINAVLLGDRIAPQTTEFREGKIIVNYADRSPGEPMSARPSVGVSKYLVVTGDVLVERK